MQHPPGTAGGECRARERSGAAWREQAPPLTNLNPSSPERLSLIRDRPTRIRISFSSLQPQNGPARDAGVPGCSPLETHEAALSARWRCIIQALSSIRTSETQQEGSSAHGRSSFSQQHAKYKGGFCRGAAGRSHHGCDCTRVRCHTCAWLRCSTCQPSPSWSSGGQAETLTPGSTRSCLSPLAQEPTQASDMRRRKSSWSRRAFGLLTCRPCCPAACVLLQNQQRPSLPRAGVDHDPGLPQRRGCGGSG